MLNGLWPLAAVAAEHDWLSRNATLVVGLAGIIFSGLVGPTVTAAWTTRRERLRDHRDTVVARRDDLRAVIDDAAKVLGSAVSNLRPLLAARMEGKAFPPGPSDLLGSLVPLGQRLRLRLPGHHDVVVQFEGSREKLIDLSRAISTQTEFEAAAAAFESQREAFLDAGRKALQAPLSTKGEI